jgi:histidine phosphotransferase ChpT
MPTDLDFTSLLASRLCHDVIGPVGAIQNGLELIAEDESMAAMAMDLIKKSAAQATARLQYARMAYGAAGGAEELDPAEAGRLTQGVFVGERATLDWAWPGPGNAPKVPVKLGMLLATYAIGAVPRGGVIRVGPDGEGVKVVAEGAQLRTPQFLDIVTGGGTVTDPRAMQPWTIERLAASGGFAIVAEPSEGALTFRTVAA